MKTKTRIFLVIVICMLFASTVIAQESKIPLDRMIELEAKVEKLSQITFFITMAISEIREKIDALEQQIGEIEKALPIQAIKEVTATAYTASKDETDSTPNITASNTRLKPYDIAVSRDLFNEGWVFGKRIYIGQWGVFVIRDLMNHRHSNRIDIYFGTKKAAKKFGEKKITVALMND